MMKKCKIFGIKYKNIIKERKNKMGADLYIEKMDREGQYFGFEVSDRAIEAGYFRDCYNNFGLFSVMSNTLNETISWWKMADEVGLKKGILPFEKVKEWKKRMFSLLEKFNKQTKIYHANYETKAKDKINDPKEIKEYHAWADKLMRFIDLAIEKESGIIWSV